MTRRDQSRPRILPGGAQASIVLAALLLCVSTAPARADGTFVWRNRAVDILEPEQKALLVHGGGQETLVLEVRFSGAPEAFGWLVPLPSAPRISVTGPWVFEILSGVTQNPFRLHSLWPGHASLTATRGGVRELSHERVGIYDTAVLEAGDSRALNRWLAKRGFNPPPRADSILKGYIRKRWAFVAMRIAVPDTSSARRLHEGTIQPIRFDFASPEPIYPLAISAASGHPSEVLLYVYARDQLVNSTCQSAAWSIEPHGSAGPIEAVGSFPQLADAVGGDDDPRFRRRCLTKLRAVLKPEQMEDVRFTPWDIRPWLEDRVPMHAATAASILGLTKPPGADSMLIELLKRSRPGSEAELSAIWALGEVGGPHAVRTLLPIASSPWSDTQREALEALGRIGAPEALPIFLHIFSIRPSASDYRAVETRRRCFDFIVRSGDPSCVPALRTLARGRTAIEATAALAACGDRTSQDSIVERIVREGAVGIRPPVWMTEPAGFAGSYNGFPSAIWPVLACFAPGSMAWEYMADREGTRHVWPSLAAYHDLLGANVGARDRLLRRAAGDERLTDAGRLILLARISHADSTDVQTVVRIWDRAVNEHPLAPGATRPIGPPPISLYNVDACAAAHTLAQLRATDGLLDVWRRRPRTDLVLAGEIATAMTRSHAPRDESFDPRLSAAAAEYAIEAWRSWFELPDSSWAPPPGQRPEVMRDYGAMDLEYRTRAIIGFLGNADSATIVHLLGDRTLPPRYRLLWLSNVPFYKRKNLYPIAFRELRALEKGMGGAYAVTPATAALAKATRESIEHTRNAMASQGF